MKTGYCHAHAVLCVLLVLLSLLCGASAFPHQVHRLEHSASELVIETSVFSVIQLSPVLPDAVAQATDVGTGQRDALLTYTDAGSEEQTLRWAPQRPGTFLLHGFPRPVRVNVSAGGPHADGYLRVSSSNYQYFAWSESGAVHRLIGENVCWASGSDDEIIAHYTTWFDHLRKVGVNYARLWLVPSWNKFQLETVAGGVGHYSKEASDLLDAVVALAEQRGLVLLFCMDSFNTLRHTDPYPDWANHPYNKANGGFLDHPGDFVRSERAADAIAARHAYAVARWGASRTILAWELWNEVDLVESFKADLSHWVSWHEDLAQRLRTIDAAKHPVTTSFSGSRGVDAINQEMDYVQTHVYNSRDFDDAIVWYQSLAAKFKKPHIFGEYGLGSPSEACKADPHGVYISNGAFAALAAGSAGTAMPWWWDNYVEPHNVYDVWRAPSQLIQATSTLPWSAGPWHKITAGTTERRSVHLIGQVAPTKTAFLLWIHNHDYTWKDHDSAKQIPATSVVVSDLDHSVGQLRVSILHPDTQTVDELAVQVDDHNRAIFPIPAFTSSLAVWAKSVA